MQLRNKNLVHTFYFPGNTGKITYEIFKHNFNYLSESRAKRIFKLFNDLLYGTLVEKRKKQNQIIKALNRLSKKLKINLENKEEENLIELSRYHLYSADYLNSLNLYKVAIMRYLNSKKLNNISELIENINIKDEIDFIKTISYLNSIAFTSSLVNKDSKEMMKILKQTLNFIDDKFSNLDLNKEEDKSLYIAIIALKTTMYQSMGLFYLYQNKFDEALENFLKSESINKELENNELVNPIEFRNIRYRIGEVYFKKAEILFHRKDIKDNINQIKELLHKSIEYLERVDILNKPYLGKEELEFLYLNITLDNAATLLLKAKCMLNILESDIE
ncbi:MAG TPA: hypothetical protein PLD27_10855 [bacterium]|nr:hypothetical protein [bacterium]HOL48121.1 hypothetical protein [bacterium]HPQ19726.1 hypothetical protein [bacterium]